MTNEESENLRNAFQVLSRKDKDDDCYLSKDIHDRAIKLLEDNPEKYYHLIDNDSLLGGCIFIKPQLVIYNIESKELYIMRDEDIQKLELE